MTDDLNASLIAAADGIPQSLKDYSLERGDISVHFRDLETALISKIENSNVVVGCVAWLTSFPILKAFDRLSGVSIIVQKEDFLRPDSQAAISSYGQWKSSLRKHYDSLPTALSRRMVGGVLEKMITRKYKSSAEELLREWFIEDPLEPIRCVGIHSDQKSGPRMHHKFLVFCDIDNGILCPKAVWTGSFNLTYNATRSLENAVYIADSDIARAYFREYAQIACLSEPLTWSASTVSPEWWHGTGAQYEPFDPLGGSYEF